ncbi:hypothetical protein HPB50_002478 [Hyalomma asiaticum]|uniref:Uncharacterized protein n=1 Tax=Hyalomma asiaticum TaxID=266040 RepID=A0ACB7RIJ6_HYAAI|nr:hypothetical protein HPB50_002478 [Hyalomma asiaticum]
MGDNEDRKLGGPGDREDNNGENNAGATEDGTSRSGAEALGKSKSLPALERPSTRDNTRASQSESSFAASLKQRSVVPEEREVRRCGEIKLVRTLSQLVGSEHSFVEDEVAGQEEGEAAEAQGETPVGDTLSYMDFPSTIGTDTKLDAELRHPVRSAETVGEGKTEDALVVTRLHGEATVAPTTLESSVGEPQIAKVLSDVQREKKPTLAGADEGTAYTSFSDSSAPKPEAELVKLPFQSEGTEEEISILIAPGTSQPEMAKSVDEEAHRPVPFKTPEETTVGSEVEDTLFERGGLTKQVEQLPPKTPTRVEPVEPRGDWEGPAEEKPAEGATVTKQPPKRRVSTQVSESQASEWRLVDRTGPGRGEDRAPAAVEVPETIAEGPTTISPAVAEIFMEVEISVEHTSEGLPVGKTERATQEDAYREAAEAVPVDVAVTAQPPEFQAVISGVEAAITEPGAPEAPKREETYPPTDESKQVTVEYEEIEGIPLVEISASQALPSLETAPLQPCPEAGSLPMPESEATTARPAPIPAKIRRRSSVLPPTSSLVPWYKPQLELKEAVEMPSMKLEDAVTGSEALPTQSAPTPTVKQTYVETTPALESFPQEAPPIPTYEETTPYVESFAPAGIVADGQEVKKKRSEGKIVHHEGAFEESKPSPPSLAVLKMRRRSSVTPPTAALVPRHRRKSSERQEPETAEKEPTYIETTPALQSYPQEAPPMPSKSSVKERKEGGEKEPSLFEAALADSTTGALEPGQKGALPIPPGTETTAGRALEPPLPPEVSQAPDVRTYRPMVKEVSSVVQEWALMELKPPSATDVAVKEERQVAVVDHEAAEGRVVPAFGTGESVEGSLVAVPTTPKKKPSAGGIFSHVSQPTSVMRSRQVSDVTGMKSAQAAMQHEGEAITATVREYDADLEEQPSSAETQSSQEEEELGGTMRKDKLALTLYDEKAPTVVLGAKKQTGKLTQEPSHLKSVPLKLEVKESEMFVPRQDEASSLVELVQPLVPRQESIMVRAEQKFSGGEYLPAITQRKEAAKGRAAWERELARPTGVDRRIERLHERKTAKYSVVIKDGHVVRSISSSSDGTEPVKEDFLDNLAYQYVASEEQVLERIVTVGGTGSSDTAPQPPSDMQPPGAGTQGGDASQTPPPEPERPEHEERKESLSKDATSEPKFETKETSSSKHVLEKSRRESIKVATKDQKRSSSFELGIPIDEQTEFLTMKEDQQPEETTADTIFEEFSAPRHEAKARETESSALESSTALERCEERPALEYLPATVHAHYTAETPSELTASARTAEEASLRPVKAAPTVKALEKDDISIKVDRRSAQEETGVLSMTSEKAAVHPAELQKLEPSTELPQLEHILPHTTVARGGPEMEAETLPVFIPQHKVKDDMLSGETARKSEITEVPAPSSDELRNTLVEQRFKPTCPPQEVIAVEKEIPALEALPEYFEPAMSTPAEPPAKAPLDVRHVATHPQALNHLDEPGITAEDRSSGLKAAEFRPHAEYDATLRATQEKRKALQPTIAQSEEFDIEQPTRLATVQIVGAPSQALVPIKAQDLISEAPIIRAAIVEAGKDESTLAPTIDERVGIEARLPEEHAIAKQAFQVADEEQVMLAVADRKASALPVSRAPVTGPAEEPESKVASDATTCVERVPEPVGTATSAPLVPRAESALDEVRTIRDTKLKATESERMLVEVMTGKPLVPPKTALEEIVRVKEEATHKAVIPTEIAQQVQHEASDATEGGFLKAAIPDVAPLLEPRQSAGAKQQTRKQGAMPPSPSEPAAVEEAERKTIEMFGIRPAVEHLTSAAVTEEMQRATSSVMTAEEESTQHHVPEKTVQALVEAQLRGTLPVATRKELESVATVSEPKVIEMTHVPTGSLPAKETVQPITLGLEELEHPKNKTLEKKHSADFTSVTEQGITDMFQVLSEDQLVPRPSQAVALTEARSLSPTVEAQRHQSLQAIEVPSMEVRSAGDYSSDGGAVLVDVEDVDEEN